MSLKSTAGQRFTNTDESERVARMRLRTERAHCVGESLEQRFHHGLTRGVGI